MKTPILSIHNLNKSISSKQILNNINFDCISGHIIALIGGNGAGKTTIMKCILGLTTSEGTIRVNGFKTNFNNHSALNDVGALIEYPSIYPFLTGKDHLKLFATGYDANIKIDSIIQELKLESYINDKARHYSLGMKQKIGIALALLNNPKLVILDEPMNGLDPQATKELRDLINLKRKQGVTFLISSHILSELQKLADDVIIIDHGKITKQTTMTDLLAANHHYLIIDTSDNQEARDRLASLNYEMIETNPIKVVLSKQVSTEKIIDDLLTSNIKIIDMYHQNGDLEESVLNIINQKEV